MAKKAYVALVDKFMSYDKNDNSKIQILSSCCSAGLGTNGGTLRKGTRDYYINGNDSKAVTGENTGYYYTEGKVLGGFIMAATEYERAYQNQDSKKILFAKDLAPKYDFSTTAGSLDATAYGTGAEKATYQWYKDGNAVDKATFATYTPTESGRYYCIAKAGNNTIQTSATTVTAKAATEGGDNNSGETTATKTATFSSNDLGCLDSSPNENERQSFTSGDVTIAVGTGFNANKTNLRFPDGGNAVATISTTNGAKIKKITLATNSSSRQLTFNPTSKGSQDKNNKQIWIYEFSGASSISVKNNSGSGINVSNIIVEYENEIVKTDLTASFSQSTIDATEGDASVDVPALTVKAGDKNFTDYKAEYTTKDANVAKVEDGKVVFVGKGTTTISVNVIPNNTTLYNDDCKAEFTVNVKEKAVPPVEPTETTNVYDFKTKVGTAVSSNTAIEVTADNIVFGANYKPKEGKYITISPADGGFKAGDLITITGKSTKGNALMTLNSLSTARQVSSISLMLSARLRPHINIFSRQTAKCSTSAVRMAVQQQSQDLPLLVLLPQETRPVLWLHSQATALLL